MKTIFIVATAILSILTAIAVLTLPENRSNLPILYWTTDPAPSRAKQIAGFEKWQKSHDVSPVKVKIDNNNSGTMKVIIQSCSGVGSEIIDVYSGAQLRQYVQAGILSDLTQLAEEYGFTLKNTFPAVSEEISIEGKQYSFPCNLSAWPLTVNREVLQRENLPMPKYDWTWDEFLKWCLAVRKVDSDGRVTRYAIWPFRLFMIWPTNGGTIFNETMTKCTLDSDKIRESTKFYYDLMFKYKVMPSPLERSAAAAQGGFGGTMLQWLGNGKILSVAIGRFGLMQLRRFPDFKPDVALIPHKTAPLMFVSARSAGINAGASPQNKKLAARFLQYLASDTYSEIIVKDSDALPPKPAATKTNEFLNPPNFSDEWGIHAKYAIAAEKYGVGREYSPFVSPITVERIIDKFVSGIESNVLTVDEALNGMASEINLEIERTVQKDKSLAKEYEKAVTIQKKIEAMKLNGEKISPEMIANPVARKLQEMQNEKKTR